jgi:DNA-binding LacI/PurR family transcriptional regulator
MPSVRELMKRFSVSIATVSHALSLLDHEGTITRRQGARITAARPAHRVSHLAAGADETRPLLFAYCDYPSQRIWENVQIATRHAARLGAQVIEYKLHPDTPFGAAVDLARQYPHAAGMMLMTGADPVDGETLERFGELPMPIAMIDWFQTGEPKPANMRSFSPDPAVTARLALNTLYERGHRRIAYIRNEPRSDYYDCYQQTLLGAAKELKLNFTNDNIFSAAIRAWENSCDAAIKQTLAHLDDIRRRKITALIFSSTHGAIAALKTLNDNGLSVPEQISVISDREYPLAEYLPVAPTYVTTDYAKLCRAAVDYALGKKTPAAPHVFIPVRVVIRDSVADLNAAPEEVKAAS